MTPAQLLAYFLNSYFHISINRRSMIHCLIFIYVHSESQTVRFEVCYLTNLFQSKLGNKFFVRKTWPIFKLYQILKINLHSVLFNLCFYWIFYIQFPIIDLSFRKLSFQSFNKTYLSKLFQISTAIKSPFDYPILVCDGCYSIHSYAVIPFYLSKNPIINWYKFI